MLPVSADFLRTVRTSHERDPMCQVRIPDTNTGVLGDPIPFRIEGGKTTATYTNGKRYDANLNIAPDDRRAWADLFLTPGAIFEVSVQVRTIGNTYESVDLFTGELASAPQVSVYGGGFQVALQDQWIRLDRCRYLTPYTTPAASRASIITSAVTGAIPGTTVTVGAGVTGSHVGGIVYDKDRVKMIQDLAAETDPDLAVGFTATGSFLIDVAPTVDVASADLILTDGENGTLIDFQRIKEVANPYNTVVVRPANAGQAWTQVVVEITDPTHPRHKSKIGVVPHFMTTTVTARPTAVIVGIQRLQAILTQQSSGRIVAVDNPALEPGDVIAAQMTTGPEEGEIIPALVTSISRDLLKGSMDLQTQRYVDADIQEAS